ncbi:MAG TPA: DUF6134 family protein [Methylomirabilota bacterium]|nr:DUF6134 family protein [Methylomirabilota bacterium]
MTRRQLLELATAAAAIPLVESLFSVRAYAAAPRDLRFHVLRHGSPIGEHRVTFRPDGPRLTVETHVDIAVTVLFFTVFRFKHDAEEVWQSERLVSVKSTTDDNGTILQVSGSAVVDGFRIIGHDGPFLASPYLLTSNALWDSRIVRENRLIDVQHGGEIGLVTKQLGDEQVNTPQGPVRASRHHMITPYYAGSVFHDSDGRWVKGLLELKGERVEYALAT